MSSTWPRVVVMGVSGSGKSTLDARLAIEMDVPFAEGDRFHSEENRSKMTAGVPLTDEDRAPWLWSLRDWAAATHGGCVLACSALRRRYRDMLRTLRDGVARAIRQRRTLEQVKALRLVDPFGLPDGFITRDALVETIYRSLTQPRAGHH